MKYRLLIYLLIPGIIGLLLGWIGFPVAAQASSEETLTIEGIDHTIRHASSEPASRIQLVREILQTVIPRYNRITGITDVDIDLTVMTTPSSDGVMADAGMASGGAATCNVRVHRMRENNNPARLRVTLAHEIAHCYQFRMRIDPSAILAGIHTDHDDNGWWVEGSAEWMASLIFPPVGPPLSATIRNFYTISSQTVLQDRIAGHYQQFWFFKALEQQRGIGRVISFIQNVPTTRAEQYTFLNGDGGPSQTVFANYGKALVRHRLPHQPPLSAAESVISTFPIRSFPAEQILMTPELSAQLAKLSFPTLRPGRGVTLRLLSGGESGYHIIGPDGEEITAEGRRYCGDQLQNPMRIVITRGINSSETGAARIEVKEVGCSDAVCYAGEWLAWAGSGVGPEEPYLYIEFGAGDNLFTISESGFITANVSGIQNLPNRTWLTVDDAVITGDFTLTSPIVEDVPGSLTANIRFTLPLMGSGSGFGGRSYIQDGMDMVEFINSLSGPLRLKPFTRLKCGNPTETLDGIQYGYLALYNGEYPGYNKTPYLELWRP